MSNICNIVKSVSYKDLNNNVNNTFGKFDFMFLRVHLNISGLLIHKNIISKVKR